MKTNFGISITRAIAILGLVASIAMLVYGQAPSNRASDEQALLKKFRDWESNVVKGDISQFENNALDDYTCVDADGLLLDKPTCIAMLKRAKIESWTYSDLRIRFYGDTAVITGQSILKGSLEGKSYGTPSRFTEVQVKHDGKWRPAALQFSRIATTSAAAQ